MCMGPARASGKISDDEKRWRAEDDCRTLERAEEIRSDKGRMSGAVGHARSKVKQMKRVASMARTGRRR